MHCTFANAFNAYVKVKYIVHKRMEEDYGLEEERCAACPGV